MLTIVYASRAARSMSAVELIGLLRSAQERNAAHAVTGMLLYAERSFMQQLEGATDDVDAIYRSISADPRHRDIRLLSRRPVSRRRFASWAMGFEHPDEPALRERLPAYRTPLEAPLVSPELVPDAATAEALLGIYAARQAA